MVLYTRSRVEQQRKILAEKQQNAFIEQTSTMNIAVNALRRSKRIQNVEPEVDVSNGKSLYYFIRLIYY